MLKSDKIQKSKTKKSNRGKTATTVQAVIDRKVCCGCGSCFVVCPASCIRFVYGKRYNYPRIDAEQCVQCGECLEVCPSAFLLRGTDSEHSLLTKKENLKSYLIHSPDDNIRLDASSGGFVTGLILHLMKKGEANGAIVAKCQGLKPWIAESYLASTREELLQARASKYAPVSNCTALKDVLEKPGRYVFVGTPCMIEGLRKLQGKIPVLKERVILAVGLVCAGMASRQSTLAFLQRYGVNLDDAYKISYRGGGWPGCFRVFNKKGNVIFEKPLLGGSLDLLVPGDHYLRCCICLDRWSCYADIVVSDPWCDEMIDNETKGWSGIMNRTRSGQEAVDSAIAQGDMFAKEVSAEEMYNYNKHLIITPEHSIHSWIALCQLLFFGRFKGLSAIFRNFIKRKGIGLLTTLRARFDRNYYENEGVRKNLLKVRPGATEHLRLRSEAAHKRQGNGKN